MGHSYKEQHFFLEAEGAHIPAALTLPEGQEVKWGIVLIPGSMARPMNV